MMHFTVVMYAVIKVTDKGKPVNAEIMVPVYVETRTANPKTIKSAAKKKFKEDWSSQFPNANWKRDVRCVPAIIFYGWQETLKDG